MRKIFFIKTTVKNEIHIFHNGLHFSLASRKEHGTFPGQFWLDKKGHFSYHESRILPTYSKAWQGCPNYPQQISWREKFMKCPTCGAKLAKHGAKCKRCQQNEMEAEKPSQTKTRKTEYSLLAMLHNPPQKNDEANLGQRQRMQSPDPQSPKSSGLKHCPIVSYLICPAFAPLKLDRNKPLTVGRDKSNQLVLPSRDVSRFHAIIKWEQSAYAIEDLDSANGTFINEDYIQKHLLENSDTIYIGTHVITYREVLTGTLPTSDVPDSSLKDTLRISVRSEIPPKFRETSSQSSFQGDLQSIGLLSLLQMLGNESKSGCLQLTQKDQRAVVYFLDGAVIHSIHGERVGRDAFFQLARWTEGNFEFVGGESPKEVTMSDNIEWLLLESMRQIDEENR